uniref:Uncharacterized protein n=1 Tax=Saccharum spontaneum TaxID=62335 RepID=A0A678T4K1_SACSP|nr:hypothetical protein LOC101753448 [Saccharum spontaneum]
MASPPNLSSAGSGSATASVGSAATNTTNIKAPLWDYVTILEKPKSGGGNAKWRCKYCPMEKLSSYSRVEAHLLQIGNKGIVLDIGNDVNVILSTPWLAGLVRVTWDFATMQLQHIRNGHPVTFTTACPQQAKLTVLALPAPPSIRQAREMAPPPPRNILSKASRACLPNALDFIDSSDIIFEHLHRAVLRQRELATIAMAISDGVEAQAWSIDQGLIFFDGQLYLPAASALLPDLLQALRQGGSANMELLALGAQPPPTAAKHNGVPAYILLGHPWPQRRPITSTTVVFIDNLSRQLVRVDNVNIALRPGSDAHHLSPGEFDLGHFMFGSILD